jgi:hypothetical protein
MHKLLVPVMLFRAQVACSSSCTLFDKLFVNFASASGCSSFQTGTQAGTNKFCNCKKNQHKLERELKLKQVAREHT